MTWGNPNLHQLDITQPETVQVEWDQARKVLYVHTDGYTALRMCRVENIQFIGLRQPPLPNDKLSTEDQVNLAQDAFWSVVAALHPEIQTGDFMPLEQQAFYEACEKAMLSWIEGNKHDETFTERQEAWRAAHPDTEEPF